MPGIKAKRKQLVRKTLMRAKAQSERPAEQRQESPEEYAQTEVQQGISDVAARTGNTAKSTARMSYRKFRAMQEKRKNLTLQGSTQSASKLTEKEKVTVPTQTERREIFKKQRFRQKAIAAETPAPQAPVSPSATPAPPPYQAQMQQCLKRQHLTREAVRRYLQKQTAATAAGNTAPIVTHAPKLPTISNKQATVEAISRGVHYIAAKIKALLSQTVRRTAQSLLALLGAGGVVLLLAMVIGAAAAVIGSPMGILFADESGDPNSIPIAEIVADTNADFVAAINDIVSAHPECSETTITYDYEDGHTSVSYTHLDVYKRQIHYFLRFVAAKALVGYGMDIMLNVFSICNGIVTDMADSMGGISEAMVSLPTEMQTAIENVGFLASIPLWLVTILGSLFITVLSFVMILTVYGRFFRLYMYTALAPLPLAAFAGESTQSVGISFLKSYVGVCLEGAVIVLACVIYSAFVSTPTVTSGEATTIVWSYLAETVFNMLVLVGLIKGSDRIIHEMMGL